MVSVEDDRQTSKDGTGWEQERGKKEDVPLITIYDLLQSWRATYPDCSLLRARLTVVRCSTVRVQGPSGSVYAFLVDDDKKTLLCTKPLPLPRYASSEYALDHALQPCQSQASSIASAPHPPTICGGTAAERSGASSGRSFAPSSLSHDVPPPPSPHFGRGEESVTSNRRGSPFTD